MMIVWIFLAILAVLYFFATIIVFYKALVRRIRSKGVREMLRKRIVPSRIDYSLLLRESMHPTDAGTSHSIYSKLDSMFAAYFLDDEKMPMEFENVARRSAFSAEAAETWRCLLDVWRCNAEIESRRADYLLGIARDGAIGRLSKAESSGGIWRPSILFQTVLLRPDGGGIPKGARDILAVHAQRFVSGFQSAITPGSD